MSDWLWAVIVGVAIGLAVGVKLAGDSQAARALRGGGVSSALHYIACAVLASVLPFVLAGIVLGLPFLTLIGTGIGLIALAGVALVIFGVVEQSAPPLPESGPELSD